MLEPARGDLRQSRSKAVRTMDDHIYRQRALLGNQGEAKKCLVKAPEVGGKEPCPEKE